MPDFDKNLNPIIPYKGESDLTPMPIGPSTPAPVPSAGRSDFGPIHTGPTLARGEGGVTFMDKLRQASAESDFSFSEGKLVSKGTLMANKRYDTYNPVIEDHEEYFAQRQGTIEKGKNGILKGVNLAATTVAGGFGMLGGLAYSATTGRLADIWDNPFMRELDAWNNKVDNEYLPNYYTQKEKEAEWYSHNNWLTANFLFDKLIKNSGFAVGAMVSGNLMSGALGVAGSALGRAAMAGATRLANGSEAFRIFTPLLRNTARAFSAGKNIEVAEIMASEISNIANLEAKASAIANIAKTQNAFSKFSDVAKRTAIAAYSSAGEASFEALQTGNEYKENLIQKFKDTHNGEEPFGDDLKDIEMKADQVGKASFMGNLALLGATEYLQLPKLLGSSYAAERQAANSLLGVADDVALHEGKWVAAATKPTTRFGKLYQGAKGVGRYVYDPKEMGQEIGQYALQVGSQNYYNKKYQSNDASLWTDGFLYGMFGRDEEGEGKGALVSKEGIEGGILGGITGGLMQARSIYKEGKARATNTQAFLAQLNDAPGFKEAFKFRMDALNRQVVLQQEEQAAVEQGERMEAKDIHTDMMHNYMAPRIKYGRFDMVKEDMKELREMASKDYVELQNQGIAGKADTRDEFLKKVDGMEKYASNLNELYKATYMRHAGQVLTDEETDEPILDEAGNTIRKYTPEALDKMIYAASKVADYDTRIPQVAASLSRHIVQTQELLEEIINDGAPQEETVNRELARIAGNKTINKTQKAVLSENLLDTVDMAMRRYNFLQEYNDILENPQKYTSVEAPDIDTMEGEEGAVEDVQRDEHGEPVVTEENKDQFVTLTTKLGERSIRIGEEYFLGRRTKLSKTGKEVYEAPIMTVLADNGDGTLKVKDSDGLIHNIKKEVFAKYKLAPVASTLKNKKAAYFLANWNRVFQHFGYRDKKGNPVVGRLIYDTEEDKDGILHFVFKDKFGRTRIVEVNRNMWVPASDKYKHGLIVPLGNLTAAEEKVQEEFIAAEDKRAELALNKRIQILYDLFNQVAERQDKAKALVAAKQEQLARARKELDRLTKEIEQPGAIDKRYKTKFRVKSAVASSITEARKMGRMVDQLEREIQEQEYLVDELENTLRYISDTADKLDDMPVDMDEFVAVLRAERISIGKAIVETGKTINALSKTLVDAKEVLKGYTDFILDLIEDFQRRYPEAPMNLQKILFENPNFLRLNETFQQELKELEDYIDFVEDGEVGANVRNLEEAIEKNQESLKALEEQLKNQDLITDLFKQKLQDYRQQKREEEALARNEELKQEWLGVNSTSQEATETSKEYDPNPLKSLLNLINGTTFFTGKVYDETLGKYVQGEEEVPEHFNRANRFGFRVGKEIDQDNVFAYMVSNETQNAILPGLMERMVGKNKNIDPDNILVAVMVRQNEDGEYELMDEFGEPLPDGLSDDEKLNRAIYQPFPAENIPDKAFRKEVSEAQKTKAKDAYKLWRDSQMAKTELPKKPERMKVSFGVPQYVTYKDETGEEKRDYDVRTPAAKSGLISEEDLRNKSVVKVVTTSGEYRMGTTSYSNAEGRVFLETGTGGTKLINRKFSKAEANKILDAIVKLASIGEKEGSVKKNDDAQDLLRWLKSTIYWGVPRKISETERKPAGYNSIWFSEEKDPGGGSSVRLFISGKGLNLYFTPKNLENNREAIVGLLTNMYNNTNIDELKSYSQPYMEFTGMDKDGKPQFHRWPNYQTYLVSSKTYDANGNVTGNRNIDDIPLVTNMRPISEAQPMNREGIYFIRENAFDLTDEADTSGKEEKAPPKAENASSTAAEQQAYGPQPNTGVVDSSKAPTVFNMDGNTPNTVRISNPRHAEDPTVNPIKTLGGITFTINGDRAIETIKNEEDADLFTSPKKMAILGNKLIKDMVLNLNISEGFLTNAMAVGNMSPGQVKAEVYYQIINALKYQLTAGKVPAEENPMRNPAPEVVAEVKPEIKEEPKEEIKTEEKPVVDPALDPVKPVDPEDIPEEPTEGKPKVDIWGTTAAEEDKVEYTDDEWVDPVRPEAAPKEALDEAAELEKQREKRKHEEKAVKPSKFRSGLGGKSKDQDTNKPYSSDARLVNDKPSKGFEKENWKEVEKMLKQFGINVPVYRVKNVIRATNGKQAWGYFQNGAIYVYESAEIGTTYHEVFEAVWKAFAGPKEKDQIIKEFRNRPGSFKYPFGARMIEYAKATDHEIKETLAEEFRARVLYNEEPMVYGNNNLIKKLFNDLINFIKTFFLGKKSNYYTDQLFNKIGSGYFSKYNPYEYQLSLAPGVQDIENAYPGEFAEFRIPGITEPIVQDIINHMTFETLNKMVAENVDLFSVKPESRTGLYERLYKEILGDEEDFDNNPGILINLGRMNDEKNMAGTMSDEELEIENKNLEDLYENIDKHWDEIVERHQVYLKTFGITFDENDDANLNREEDSNKSFEVDGRTVDTYRKTSPTIRLLLSAIPKSDNVKVKGKDKKGNTIEVDDVQLRRTAINGYKLIPGDEVFITLMNRLHDSRTPEEMLNRLSDFALEDPSYSHLYRALTKNEAGVLVKNLDTRKYNKTNLDLINAFWKTFKKQNADVLGVFVLPGGEVVIGDASLASAAKQVKKDSFNAVIEQLRTNDKYVSYDVKERVYNVKEDVVNKIKFDETFKSYENFLKNLGIDFSLKEYESLSLNRQKEFRIAVQGMLKSLKEIKNVSSFTSKSVSMEGTLMKLAAFKVLATNPIFDSTYFSLTGERSQSFIGVNVLSNFFDEISKLKKVQGLSNTNYKFLIDDVFSKGTGSLILNKMFDIDPENFQNKGERREGTDDIMRPVYIDGTIDQEDGDKTESSKLTYKQRLLQELNLNFNGVYLNLVPGDASIEWAAKMHEAHDPFVAFADTESSKGNVFTNVFKDYFIAELRLARDNRKIFTGKNGKDLRFFKDILPPGVYKNVMSASSNKMSPEAVYDAYSKEINKAVVDFVEADALELEQELERYGVIKPNEDGTALSLEKVDMGFQDNQDLTREQIRAKLKFITVNYMIANTEYHKLLYSDPFLYNDELKRIKNFNSPRQAILHSSKVISQSLSNTYNEGFEDDPDFYTDFDKQEFDTITLEDPYTDDDTAGVDYNAFEDTDGGGIIFHKFYRLARILAADWNADCERQYRHDVGYEKLVKGGATEAQIEAYEENNPNIPDAYKDMKPIVAGAKDSGRNFNDVVMDKFALVPYSFRLLHKLNPNSNAIKLYNKAQAENVAYAVYGTGRKVGSEVLTPLYDKDGNFDETPFRDAKVENNPNSAQKIIKIPYNIFSIQAEVPSKKTDETTEGSQVTQLATLDYMEAGIPLDYKLTEKEMKGKSEQEILDLRYEKWNAIKTEEEKETTSPLYKEMMNNKKLLEARIAHGFEKLMVKTGIRKTAGGYYIADREKLIDTLTDEILKREVNENILEAFKNVKTGKVVMEATPAYKQIRNILFSMANKALVSKKMTGRMAVQVPERLLEEGKIKVTKGVNSKGKEVDVFNSKNLKFYVNKDGERVCEIMAARWFKSNRTDKELLDYLNKTDEGQKILSGVAFRIPTQKQNSIDVFKIKQFLPREFKDSVVIPAALVNKVGSDFDIDKLSMYFKNVNINKDGYPELVKMKDDSNSTVQQRYYEYIMGHMDKVRDVVAEYASSSKEKAMAKEAFEEAEDLKEEIATNNAVFDNIYSRGYKIFSSLPKDIKEDFYNLRDELSGKGLKGTEKFLHFRDLAATTANGLNKKAANYDKTWNTLKQLIDNYDQLLYAHGYNKGFIDAFVEARAEGRQYSNEFKFKLAKALAENKEMVSFEDFQKRSIVMQNTSEAVDNAYQESLYNLITDPLNFERLVVPNSADPLKKLNKEIRKLKGLPETDNASPGKMLSRSFMSKLRHDFVTGKQAIGIAALAQTNHANNQKSPMTIDDERLKLCSVKDREFLGKANIAFQRYNSIMHNGKLRPTLSMIKDKAGNYISDTIGMFIDGYVDISKGAWIMELGATPNVAGTWLFLVKLGVPINEVAYFMNQPIIQDFLRNLESAGYSYVFNQTQIEATMSDYAPDNTERFNWKELTTLPSEEEMKELLKKDPNKLNDKDKAMQQFMLMEFLKYSKMSEHLFYIQQGSNYNTANFSDSFLMLQKEKQLERAQSTVISSVDNILSETFIGTTKFFMEEARDAYSELLISDKPGGTRDILSKVLDPYVFYNSKEFLKISGKSVVDLFDWVIQTSGDKARNKYIKQILVGSQNVKNAAQEIIAYKEKVKRDPDHPLHDNLVLKSFSITKGAKEGKTDVLEITGMSNKVYEQNLIINSFIEIKDQLGEEESDLYKKIVGLTILQSGLATSRVAFTHLLPYEDFITTYNENLSTLDTNDTLHKFVDLKVFERTNWSNTNIVPSKKPTLIRPKSGEGEMINLDLKYRDKRLIRATYEGKIPMTINVAEQSKEGNFDVITYSWSDSSISATQKGLMRRRGDFSYIKKGLFQKVYTDELDANGNRIPYIQEDLYNGVVYRKYIYKMINAWGDSFRGREMYDEERVSELDNDYIKVRAVFDNGVRRILKDGEIVQPGSGKQIVSGEVSDSAILAILDPNGPIQVVPEPSEVAPVPAAAPIREIMPETTSDVDINLSTAEVMALGIPYGFWFGSTDAEKREMILQARKGC